MHRAVSVSASLDLRPLVAILSAHGVPHHITEESGKLVVWARSEPEAELISEYFDAWQQGRLQPPEGAAIAPSELLPVKGMLQNLVNAAWLAPVTVILIAACLVVAVISNLGADAYAVRGLFFPELNQSGGLSGPLSVLQLFTPALLHFGAVHLIFNTLWLWYFGRVMEPELRSWRYLLIMVWMAVAGNVAQYMWTGASNFGGMSGVVYGQLGFIWVWQSLLPNSQLRLPLGMIMLFLVALVLMEVLASGYIASAAHAGGLVSGMLAGALAALIYRSTR
ncbi:rhomboid family intramembrane serine protease [Pseudohongiella sp. O18]|uniref:rhomboid family intramembrane serine protease n=1 Tax=Pseudohongiella sp. O18 TaxID=2904248 RepID=UPI001F025B29|nr:rhomboid family intramembrane serine protease [Pseudohongiella sp. O18]